MIRVFEHRNLSLFIARLIRTRCLSSSINYIFHLEPVSSQHHCMKHAPDYKSFQLKFVVGNITYVSGVQ
jgi:hypothetical protein